MDKLYIKNDIIKYINQIVIKTDKYLITNPSEELILNDGWIPYKHEESLEECKKNIEYKILDFDKSSNINEFFINNKSMWLDRETRMSIRNSTEYEKKSGRKTTTLWAEDFCLEIDCDLVLKLLETLEIYAKDCYNQTRKHINSIKNLKTKEEIKDYDFTLGYPEKLKFNIK